MVNRNFKLPFLGSSKFTFLCLSAVLILLGKAQFQAAATSEVFTQVEKLSSTRRQDRLAAVRSLRQIGSPVVPILMEALESPEPSIRKNAAFALGSMGSEAVEAIPALFSALTTWEQTDRIDAALALHQIALASPDNLNRVLAELETALGDQSASVRQGATVGLGLFGAAATPAIDPLIATLQDPDEEVRVGAAIALKRIGAPAIPALTAALTHENAQVRAKAAFALGRINAAAMPKVAATLETSDRQIRQTAAQSLEKLSATQLYAQRGNTPTGRPGVGVSNRPSTGGNRPTAPGLNRPNPIPTGRPTVRPTVRPTGRPIPSVPNPRPNGGGR